MCSAARLGPVRGDHLHRPHFPVGLFRVRARVWGVAGGGPGVESEWRGKPSWREVPGGFCHIPHAPRAAPSQSHWFRAVQLPTRLSWAGRPGCLSEVGALSHSKQSRGVTAHSHRKPQRSPTHPLLPHAKLGIAFPPAADQRVYPIR